jgi:hypothetical protein
MYLQQTKIINPVWNITFDIPEPAEKLYEKHFTNVEEIASAELLATLKSIDMFPEYVRLFVWPKNYCGIWHIDGTIDNPRHSAINWILHGSGLIQFNNSVELHSMPGVHLGKHGTMSDNIEAETTGHGCIINTGACHRVVTGEDGRTTLSLGWKNNDTLFSIMLEKLRQINII